MLEPNRWRELPFRKFIERLSAAAEKPAIFVRGRLEVAAIPVESAPVGAVVDLERLVFGAQTSTVRYRRHFPRGDSRWKRWGDRLTASAAARSE